MDNRNKWTHTLISLGALGFVMLSNTVYADVNKNRLNKLLHGDYEFTVFRNCVQTPISPGFDPDTHELLVDAEFTTFVDTGTFRFNGKGLVTTPVTDIVNLDPSKLSAGDTPVTPGSMSSCEGSYEVNSDRSFNAEVTCAIQLPNGLTLTITPFISVGQIERSRRIATTSEIQGNVQTVTASIGETVVQVSERICTTSGTMVKKRTGNLRMLK